MFELPQKSDLDRRLSELMHENRRKLTEECDLIKNKAGSLRGTPLIVGIAAKKADQLHRDAITQAAAILLDFIERMKRPPVEIVGWARPHLENLGESLMAVVPPNDPPEDNRGLTQPYRAVFQQRLDGMLRDVEIGLVKGAGFARAEKVETKEEWCSAAEAVQLLKPVFKSEFAARMTICKRANKGMIRARAERFITDSKAIDNVAVPPVFWWAEGHEALTQNWTAGDFDTWVNFDKLTGNIRYSGPKVHLEAINVTFMRSDIEKLIPPGSAQPVAPSPSPSVGGRPPADWWEDLLIDLCFKHFHGELPHQKQADIVRAMQDWITAHGYDASESTIKLRARKLADAIRRDETAGN